MGAHIPETVRNQHVVDRMQAAGLVLFHQGKVRDTYAIPDHPNLLLSVATDRVSIFDFVLPATITAKGHVLTALTVFWLAKALKNIRHHLVAFGSGIDAFLPDVLHDDMDLQCRGLIVQKHQILPIECIVRGYLTGSVLKEYQGTGLVSGHALPQGLHDGSKLPAPVFTPSTKAEVGHDVNLPAAQVRKQYGMWPADLSLLVYYQGLRCAQERGIILADTKFEFSVSGELCDEVLTPDSSRYWLVEDWERAEKDHKAPQGFDKQLVREWGKRVTTPFSRDDGGAIVGIHQLKPEVPDHRSFVSSLEVDLQLREETTQLYLRGLQMLTGMRIAEFQDKVMGVRPYTRSA